MRTSTFYFAVFSLIYVIVFVLPLIARPFWPFRLRQSVPAKPEAVWDLLKDNGNVPFTFPHIEKIDLERDPDDPDIVYCTIHHKRRAKPFRYVSRLVASEPVESIACEILNMERTRVLSRCEYHLSPEGQGTLLELRAKTRIASFFNIFSLRRIYRRHLVQVAKMAEWS